MAANGTAVVGGSDALLCSESDLDALVKEFDHWQKGATELNRENKNLVVQLKGVEKKCEAYSQSEKHLMGDNSRLCNVVKDLHGILNKRCDREDENYQLKEQVELSHREMVSLEEGHKHQLDKAMATLTTLQQSHQSELAKAREVTSQHMRKEVQSLQDTVVSKETEIRQLQKSLAELQRDRHTELVKLRLEYDAKLLKLQKHNVKTQSVHQSSVTSDIYRQKLQALRSEYDKETMSLKRKVAELEKQLASTSGTKRRKY